MGRAERNRQRAARTSAAPQCIVASDVSLGRKCAQALKVALGLNYVEHQSWQFRGATSLYFLTAPPAEAEVRGRNRPVLPLPDGKRWLHVAIDLYLIAKGIWRVHQISIGLLQGEQSILQKQQVLRAEWQIHDTVDDSGHAQPHWHVLSAAGITELPTFDEVVVATPGFEEFLAEALPEPAGDGTFSHFHYAMVTDWHRSPSTSPCYVLADEAAVVSWLEGCVRYIRHQLDHVDRKASNENSLDLQAGGNSTR